MDTQFEHQIAWKNGDDGKAASDTLEKMSGAFSTLMKCLGDPYPERESLKRTPLRAAKAFCYFTKGYEDNLESKRFYSI